MSTKTIKKIDAPEVMEAFDDQEMQEDFMSTGEILANENDILQGMLELANSRNDPEQFRNVQIKRNGVVKLEFRIRPMTEPEIISCTEQATKYAPAKGGKPRTAIKTDTPTMRSLIIYTATVDEDRKKVWNHPEILKACNVLQGHQVVDYVLKAGEKDQIMNLIDEISGYYDSTSVDDTAKN